MKKIASLPKLSRIFKTFPVDYPEGVLTLQSSSGAHEFLVKELRFVEYRSSDRRIPAELGRRFATHELITKQPPAFERYDELWDWIDVPDIFHFHKERFKHLAYHAFLRAILEIDFEEGLPVRFQPGTIKCEEGFLPSMQLHRFASDILKNSEGINDYEAFAPDAIFVAGSDLASELSFEALFVFQLLKEPKTFLEVLEESFFTPAKTTSCIRELLRLQAIVQMGGGIELNFSALSESLANGGDELEDDDGPAVEVESPELEQRDSEESFVQFVDNGTEPEEREEKKLSEVVEKKLPPKRKPLVPLRRREAPTEDYLLSSLAYLVLFLLIALPWFMWHDLLSAF